MSDINYSRVLKKGWKKIAVFAVASALFATGLSFLFPLRYSSTMRILIIQKKLAETDPYTAIKASEQIADNLGQIIYTTSFFDQVMAAKFNIDQSVFSKDEQKKRRQWNNMISTQVIRGSGMLVVTVYHTDPQQAKQISRAIAFVLTTNGADYVGGGDLQIRLVDDPLVSKWPVRPNIPANAFTGFVLGMLAGAGYVLVAERRKSSMLGL